MSDATSLTAAKRATRPPADAHDDHLPALSGRVIRMITGALDERLNHGVTGGPEDDLLCRQYPTLHGALSAVVNGHGGWKPPETEEPTRSSWAPLDLEGALANEDPPETAVLRRKDGLALLYLGRTHSFQGESETLKSWAWQVAAVEQLAAGHDVLVFDFEDDERGVVGRLRALGATEAAIREHFVYSRPEEPLFAKDRRPTRGHVDLMELVRSRTWALAVVDGVTEAMLTEGLDLLSNADVAAWNRRLPRVLADAGAAVVSIDHVSGKGKESPGRYAIGGQHKLAGLSGAAYTFTLTRPLGRAQDKERTGVVAIGLAKDRPGFVRGRIEELAVGRLELTSWPDGGITAALLAPGGEEPDLGLVRRILEYLATYDGATKNTIEKELEGKAANVRNALAWAVGRDYVRVERVGQAHRHHLTDAGRGQLEP